MRIKGVCQKLEFYRDKFAFMGELQMERASAERSVTWSAALTS